MLSSVIGVKHTPRKIRSQRLGSSVTWRRRLLEVACVCFLKLLQKVCRHFIQSCEFWRECFRVNFNVRDRMNRCGDDTYLGLISCLSRKVENALLFTKVLNHNLETVWPAKEQMILLCFAWPNDLHDYFLLLILLKSFVNCATRQHTLVTCQTDCRAHSTLRTHWGRSALWVWWLVSRSQSR